MSRSLRILAAGAVLALAAPAGAARWPQQGGDAGHSGDQPVHQAALGASPAPLAFPPVLDDPGAPRTSPVIVGPADPARQLVAYGRYAAGSDAHAYIHLRSLTDGAERIPPDQQDVDDSDGTDTLGTGATAISPVDSSSDDALGELFVVHNDDNSDAATANGCPALLASSASDNDIAIAQFDETSGAQKADVAVGQAQGNSTAGPACPVRDQPSDGYTIESSPVITPPLDATGKRMIFFLAAKDGGGDPRLFGLTIDKAGSPDAVIHATTPQVRDVPGANPLASPTLLYLHDPQRFNADPVLYVAVPCAGGAHSVVTFQIDAIGTAGQDGPASGAIDGTPQTASVPVTANGMLPGQDGSGVATAPALYVAFATADKTTTVHELVQGSDPATLVDAPGTTPTAVEGAPAPGLAVSALAAPGGEQPGRVAVATGANLVLLDSATLAPVERYLDAGEGSLTPGTTGFTRTIPATSGGLAFLSSDEGAQGVFSLADGEPVPGFVENGANNLSSFAVGQPAYAEGHLAFLDDSGLFVYQTQIQPPPSTQDVPPVARLTATPNPAAPGQTVTLDGSGSSDADGHVVTYEWDLDGNGTFERNTGQTATTTAAYDRAGTYHVALRVTDNDGATSTVTADVVVSAAPGNAPPSASFTIDPDPARAATTVRFDASASHDPDGSIARYEWDFDGNGSFETSTGASPKASRVYRQAGVYNVKLRVTDDGGTATEVIRQLTVTPSACAAARCAAALTQTVKAGRRGFRVGGRLERPAGVPVSACSGHVTVTARAGKRVVARRRVEIDRRCRYRATLAARARPLRFSARFAGNRTLLPVSAPVRTVRR